MRAAESAKWERLGSPNHELSLVRCSCGSQEKDVQPQVLTHLPTAIPVGQEPKHYAEDHVAKKHHLRGFKHKLWRIHPWKHQAALLFELWVS